MKGINKQARLARWEALQRLSSIAHMIEEAKLRCVRNGKRVSAVRLALTNDEMRRMYALAKGFYYPPPAAGKASK